MAKFKKKNFLVLVLLMKNLPDLLLGFIIFSIGIVTLINNVQSKIGQNLTLYNRCFCIKNVQIL